MEDLAISRKLKLKKKKFETDPSIDSWFKLRDEFKNMLNYERNIPRWCRCYDMASLLVTDGLQMWKAYANIEPRIKTIDKEERYTHS